MERGIAANQSRPAASCTLIASNEGRTTHMPFGIGIWEMLILLLVLLLVFGPKRLPEMGKHLGKGMREFKESVTGMVDDVETGSTADEPFVSGRAGAREAA